jgi:hypothetical protein
MEENELRVLATQLTFEHEWDVWVKTNMNAWDINEMKHIYTIRTIAEMWQLLNNIPPSYVGLCNVFIMHKDVKPVWETNGEMFKNGGCWSVVVRKHEWRHVFNELVMALLGELLFGASVKGACLVPVNTTHVICKIWCTTKSKIDATALTKAMRTLDPSTARFKEFDL